MEYACAATNVQMYSVGEETEVVPNTFEEATTTGSRWVYKINADNSIGQPRLMPTALERPSPSRRGIVIFAPEKSTSWNGPASMGTPNIDDGDLGRRVDDGKRSTGTDKTKNGAMDHEKEGGGEGDPQEYELRRGQRRYELDKRPIPAIIFVSFYLYPARLFYRIRFVTRNGRGIDPPCRLCASLSFSQMFGVCLLSL